MVGRDLGLKFRQLSDGLNFIQLIYSSSSISDCEYTDDTISMTDFLNTFYSDVYQLTTVYNSTMVPLGSGVMPQEMIRWMDYKKLKEKCERKQEEAKKAVKERRKAERENRKRERHHQQNLSGKVLQVAEDTHQHHQIRASNVTNQALQYSLNNRGKRAVTDYFLFPGTLWCGASDAATRYQDLGLMSVTDKCCRRHDKCKHNIAGFSQRYGLFNSRPFTISHCWCDRSFIGSSTTPYRSRRDLSSYLRMPGTKWCGKGQSASKYTDVGLFGATDKCCRRHDSACPFWIAGFDTKYGLFNWRVNTVMHCHCDERFRTCLKRVGTSDANLVGKLFFNIVQTKCFVFKAKKTCIKRSWWGKCQKKKRLKRAILRDNMPY